MALFSPMILLMLVVSIALQIFAIYMIPLTKGLTQALPVIIWAVAVLIATAMVVRIAHAGVSLSLVVPVMSALVPLGGIAVAILVYGEPASFPKIGALVAACALVGVANMV